MTIKVFTVAEMVAAERAADAAGVSYAEMMETAGRRVAEAISARMPVDERRILILVGPGNNGGDGLVAGRYLAKAGADVAFYLYKSRDAGQDANYALVQQMGLFVAEAGLDQRYRVLRTRLQSTDIMLDALLGTGVTRPIGGNLASLFKEIKSFLSAGRAETNGALTSIAHLNQQTDRPKRPMIVAVDCPSGLNCDSGALDPLAIESDLTVTFAGPKQGHFYFPGAAACGELVVADINIAADLPEVKNVRTELATARMARSLLPDRSSSGHKGTFGTALIAAGSEHYWGAPLLAAQGAYRVGAGLVALVVPEAIRSTVAGQMPAATYPPIKERKIFNADSARFLFEQSDPAKGMLIGPGIGPAADFIAALLDLAASEQEEPQKLPPLVIDADGLNMLAKLPNWWQRLPSGSILTPHPGEMARLVDVPLAELKKADRVELAREWALRWGHVVLLKGAYTVVADPGGICAILPFANPLLAVGGSGDVLSGVIVGLLAQGLIPYDAALLGGYIHGAAAELAVETFGDAGMLASELAEWIPQVRRQLLGVDQPSSLS